MGVVEEQIVIQRPSHEVWAVLADFGNIDRWSPVVNHSAATNGVEGEGCERSCEIGGMGRVVERAVGWDEGRQLTIEVEGAPMMRDMRATQTLEPRGHETVVTMRAEFRAGFGPIGALAGATMMTWMVRRNARRTLEGLRDYVESSAGVDGVSPAAEAEA